MTRTSKLDELTKDEREDLIKRLAASQDDLCYVCGRVINRQVHEVDVDHKIALAQHGPDDESNWGLTHKATSRQGRCDFHCKRILYRFKKMVDKHIPVTNAAALHSP